MASENHFEQSEAEETSNDTETLSETDNQSSEDNTAEIEESTEINDTATSSGVSQNERWESLLSGPTSTSLNNINGTSNSEPELDEDKYTEADEYWDELSHRGETAEKVNQRRIDEEVPLFTDMRNEPGAPSDFMQDPTDFTDVAAEAKTKYTLKIVSLCALAAVALAGGSILGMNLLNDKLEPGKTVPTEQVIEDVENVSNVKEPKRPLLDLFTGAPTVGPGKVTTLVEKSTVTTSENIALTVKGIELQKTQLECAVTNSTDFCLVAISSANTLKSSESTEEISINKPQKLDIYYLKDAAHSRLLEAPESFKKVEIAGSPAAAVMEIKLIAGKSTPIIVVAANNSSGFMIALPDATSVAEAEAIATALTITQP